MTVLQRFFFYRRHKKSFDDRLEAHVKLEFIDHSNNVNNEFCATLTFGPFLFRFLLTLSIFGTDSRHNQNSSIFFLLFNYAGNIPNRQT
jgi:hypothetical protein